MPTQYEMGGKMKILKYTLLLAVLFLASRLIAQPDAPQNLQATTVTYQGLDKSVVHLKWDKVKDSNNENVPLYEIFRKDGDISSDNEFVSIGEVLWAGSKIDHDVRVGNTYTYYVVAKDFSNNESSPSESVEITVGDDATGGGGATIAGKVTEAGTDSPLSGVYVILVSTSSFNVQSTETDAEGNYSAEVFPGEYIIYFRALQDYFPQFYNDARHVWEATRISLNDGENIGQIDAALIPMGEFTEFTVSGNVSNTSGSPLNARVDIFISKDDRPVRKHLHAMTDGNGDFSIKVRENCEIVVFAQARNYFGEFYNNAFSREDAERILVTGDISDIDFVLDEMEDGNSSIAGKVSNSEGDPVAAMVLAIKLGEPRTGRYSNLRDITEDGNYSFEKLHPGDYILFIVPDGGYLPTFYNEDGNQTNLWQDASTLTLNENTNLSDRNIVVSPIPDMPSNGIAQLDGNIKDNLGQPVGDVYVSVHNDRNELVQYTFSDADGNYEVENLVPGFYSISCSNYGLSSEQESDLYIGIDNANSANFVLTPDTPVSVDENKIINKYELQQNYPNPFNPSTTINFSLKEGGNVQIKVFDILGSEVATILNKNLVKGNYDIGFNASELPSGIYIYQLKSKNITLSRKMMLMK